MDAKAIVKEMLASGLSKGEIISNLQELGVADAEKYYEEALRAEGKGIIAAGEGGGKMAELFANDAAAEKEAKDILESETKPLFAGSTGNAIFSPKPSGAEKERAERAVEEIPKLEITSIGVEGERKSDIGEMLGMKPEGEKLVRKMPSTSLGDLDAVEEKLDESIALLKAIYDIDRKILEANREVLLRLKTEKT